jgi:hypothetical protein
MLTPNFCRLVLAEVFELVSQVLGHGNQERRVCGLQRDRYSLALWLRVHGCNTIVQFRCQRIEEFQPYVQLVPFLKQLGGVERFKIRTVALFYRQPCVALAVPEMRLFTRLPGVPRALKPEFRPGANRILLIVLLEHGSETAGAGG